MALGFIGTGLLLKLVTFISFTNHHFLFDMYSNPAYLSNVYPVSVFIFLFKPPLKVSCCKPKYRAMNSPFYFCFHSLFLFYHSPCLKGSLYMTDTSVKTVGFCLSFLPSSFNCYSISIYKMDISSSLREDGHLVPVPKVIKGVCLNRES